MARIHRRIGILFLALAATTFSSTAVPGLAEPAERAMAPAGLPSSASSDGWKPWVLPSVDAIGVPAPPARRSAEETRELRELKAEERSRTRADVELARHWAEVPATAPWTELLLERIAAHAVNPPRAARSLALVHVAAHDAVLAAHAEKEEHRRPPPAAVDRSLRPALPATETYSYPSEHAAVAGAVSRVLAYLFPQDGAQAFEDLAGEIARSRVRAGVSWPSDVSAGLELGREVADRVLQHAAADGAGATWDGRRIESACTWKPTPPAYADPPLEPTWGRVRPWLLSSGDDLRPPPPPPCGSSRLHEEMIEVHAAVEGLSDEEREIAEYWADGPGGVTPPGHWAQIALRLVRAGALDTPAAARVFAYLGTALHDAAVSVWDAKYAYWSVRPVTYLREHVDPAFESPVATPPFPGYVSGHSGFSGAASRVLGAFFPEDRVALRAMAGEAAWSRLLGGIHIPADNEVGLEMGKAIGDRAIARMRSEGG